MALLYVVNLVASLIVASGITFAVFSKHVCDGVFIKKCLAAAAIGFAANAATPNLHTTLWIACSMAALVFFIVLRVVQAKIKHKKPKFFCP